MIDRVMNNTNNKTFSLRAISLVCNFKLSILCCVFEYCMYSIVVKIGIIIIIRTVVMHYCYADDEDF